MLFLFKVISAYLIIFLSQFKKFSKTVSKGIQGNSIPVLELYCHPMYTPFFFRSKFQILIAAVLVSTFYYY
jgi:hypothetical protein